jgi:uracil-DNA glycosylase
VSARACPASWSTIPTCRVPDADVLERLRLTASTCTRCPLAEGRTQVVFGVGNPAADLLFVGEGPGRDEDLAGEPFVGRSGKLLDRLMWEEIGLTRAECYIANVVKCRPPNNRDPAPNEIEACRPYLTEQVTLIDPSVIVTLGNFATKLLLESTRGIRELRGRVFERGRAQLVPTYHPAYVLRAGGEAMAEMRADLVRAKRLMAAGRA